AGLQVVASTLAAWGIPTAGLTFVDGSGLDRGDRLTCQALLGVMDHVGTTGPVAAALPIANQTGTLQSFFGGSPMAGKLHAKTGTLPGSKALTGFVPADDGHTITFSFVYNGPNSRESAASLWGRLGQALATYPYHPDLAPFSPGPVVTAGCWRGCRCSRSARCCCRGPSSRCTSSSRATEPSSPTAWRVSPNSASC